MAYTNKAYFLTKINVEELNKLTNNTDSNLTEAIASADSLIDSYLTNVVVKGSLPLVSPPIVIKQASYDLGIYFLHDRIQYDEIPQWVKDKYTACIDTLTKIAKGVIGLDINTEDAGEDDYSEPDDNVLSSGNYLRMDRGAF